VALSAVCTTELDAAEGKVQLLIKQRDGSLKTETFPTEKPF
jgi:exodeoxyribonuclease VII small subunit